MVSLFFIATFQWASGTKVCNQRLTLGRKSQAARSLSKR